MRITQNPIKSGVVIKKEVMAGMTLSKLLR